jgi:hypothetical protein
MRQTLFKVWVDMVWTQPNKLGLSSSFSSRVWGKGLGSSMCCLKSITLWFQA